MRVWFRDAQGCEVSAVNAEGFATNYGYDLNDNVLMTVEPNWTVSRTNYDTDDKAGLTTETASDGSKRTKGVLLRDKAGNPLHMRDYLGNVTVTEYHVLNLPQSVFDPAGGRGERKRDFEVSPKSGSGEMIAATVYGHGGTP